MNNLNNDITIQLNPSFDLSIGGLDVAVNEGLKSVEKDFIIDKLTLYISNQLGESYRLYQVWEGMECSYKFKYFDIELDNELMKSSWKVSILSYKLPKNSTESTVYKRINVFCKGL